MNGIWLWVSGMYRIRLTGAEPERTLRVLSEQITLERLEWESSLEVCFLVAGRDVSHVRETARKRGDRIEILEQDGFPALLRSWAEYPIIAVTLAVLLAASAWIPGRLLFVQVEGNAAVPAQLILEKAAECGLSFGAEREAIRSEQIKNQMLDALPELSWVGVNTADCTATITVQERQPEPEIEPLIPGNIVASADAVITSVTATAGKALCAPGDAVKQGQVLISGFTDLGLCIHVEQAEGEVYGLTRHEPLALLPLKTFSRQESGDTEKKYSLIFGKKRINFYSDSGILHIGCGKMTQIRYLRLPGGWTLPVALVIETYTPASLQETDRWEQSARETLRDTSAWMVKKTMTAGTILDLTESCSRMEQVWLLRSVYECQEMIGRRSNGIITEGDMQYDGKNRERGAS